MNHSGEYKGFTWHLRRKRNTAHKTRGYILSIKKDGQTVWHKYIPYFTYLGSPETPTQQGENAIKQYLNKGG